MSHPEASEMNVELLKHLDRFALEIASQGTEAELRQTACDCARQLCDAGATALFLVDRASGALAAGATTSGGDEAHLWLRGAAARAVASRQPAIAALDQAAGPEAGGSAIMVPLLARDTVVGVLAAVRPAGRPPFERGEVALLGHFAPHVAAALRHLHTEADLRRAQDTLIQVNGDLEARVQERTALISRGKREWEATFDAIADPVVVLDEHLVRRANRRYKLVSGDRPWTELLGRPCHQVLAGRKTPCEGCPLLSVDRAGEVRVGEALYHASAYRLAGDGAWVVYYRDITEQRRLTERLRQAERLAAVGQLASGAAHEINNPLALVISNLTTLREASHGADAARILDESLLGAGRIADVVKSLRELKGQEVGRAEPIDVNEAARRTAARVLGENSGVRLALAATQKVRVSPAQLELALEHVLRNARQAVTRGDEIRVAAYDAPAATVIEVVDLGCGIPADHLPHVFEPFFTTRNVGSGRGLGLTVAWGVVKRHGGEVTIHSEVGAGTTVTMTFPHEGRAAPGEVKVGRYAERESGLFQVPTASRSG